MDTEECMRMFATEHIIMNFDSYGMRLERTCMPTCRPAANAALHVDLDWLMLAAQAFARAESLTALSSMR